MFIFMWNKLYIVVALTEDLEKIIARLPSLYGRAPGPGATESLQVTTII